MNRTYNLEGAVPVSIREIAESVTSLDRHGRRGVRRAPPGRSQGAHRVERPGPRRARLGADHDVLRWPRPHARVVPGAGGGRGERHEPRPRRSPSARTDVPAARCHRPPGRHPSHRGRARVQRGADGRAGARQAEPPRRRARGRRRRIDRRHPRRDPSAGCPGTITAACSSFDDEPGHVGGVLPRLHRPAPAHASRRALRRRPRVHHRRRRSARPRRPRRAASTHASTRSSTRCSCGATCRRTRPTSRSATGCCRRGPRCGRAPASHDVESGYRIFRLGALADALDYYRGYKYSETVEVAVVLCRLGYECATTSSCPCPCTAAAPGCTTCSSTSAPSRWPRCASPLGGRPAPTCRACVPPIAVTAGGGRDRHRASCAGSCRRVPAIDDRPLAVVEVRRQAEQLVEPTGCEPRACSPSRMIGSASSSTERSAVHGAVDAVVQQDDRAGVHLARGLRRATSAPSWADQSGPTRPRSPCVMSRPVHLPRA